MAMRSAQGFGSLWHLAGRFLGSLLPVGPTRSAQSWASSQLLPAEIGLFSAMSGPDRRHAIGVARRAIRLVSDSDAVPPGGPNREFVAAALLHDVGKIEAHLGTFGRVAATVAALALHRDKVVSWAGGGPGAGFSRWSIRGWQARMGRYLMHDSLGAQLLEDAGSDGLTITWAREHHLPATRWTVEPHLAHALKEADGD